MYVAKCNVGLTEVISQSAVELQCSHMNRMQMEVYLVLIEKKINK